MPTTSDEPTPGIRPVAVLATIDPIDREVALLDVLTSHPDVVAVVHDIRVDARSARLRRRLLNGTTVLEDVWVDLEHVCPSCAVREDAGPAVANLLQDPRWAGAVVALPPGAELLPATAGLTAALRELRAPGVLAAGVAYARARDMADALLGDADATIAQIPIAPGDDRALAEIVLGQVPPADLVVLDGGTSGRARDLADAIRRPGSELVTDAHSDWLSQAFSLRHCLAHAEAHLHASSASPGVGAERVNPDEYGWWATDSDVWTLDLHTAAALHPGRLLQEIDTVANGPRVVWGRFWVPNRPDSVCGLYGGGRQASVGVADHWGGADPSSLARGGCRPGPGRGGRRLRACRPHRRRAGGRATALAGQTGPARAIPRSPLGDTPDVTWTLRECGQSRLYLNG